MQTIKDLFGYIWHFRSPENRLVHREDGPAKEGPNGEQAWYIDGKELRQITSQEQFERYMKLKAFW